MDGDNQPRLDDDSADKIYPQCHYEGQLDAVRNNIEEPMEIVREMISNGYDAEGDNLDVLPIYSKKAIIFGDDGCGLSTAMDKKIRGTGEPTSSYAAFFALSGSTRTKGTSVGHMCMGTKLVLANSTMFILISRNKDMVRNTWLYKHIDNFSGTREVTPEVLTTSQVTKRLAGCAVFMSPGDPSVTKIRDYVFKKLETAAEHGGTGTWIISQCALLEETLALQAYKLPSKGAGMTTEPIERCRLWWYIRTRTRHGSIFISDASSQSAGFTNSRGTVRTNLFGISAVTDNAHIVNRIRQATMHIHWVDDGELQSREIPFGFPAIPVDRSDLYPPDKVLKINRHGDLPCQARFTGVITDSSKNKYQVMLMVDGRKKAHFQYDFLDRNGPIGSRSGLNFGDFRGIVFAAEGIPVQAYRKDNLLKDPMDPRDPLENIMSKMVTVYNMYSHFVLFINGNFTVQPNRNSIADANRQALERDSTFKGELMNLLKKFRDTNSHDGHVFKNLLRRLSKESPQYTSAACEVEAQVERKKDLLASERFYLCNLPSPLGDIANGLWWPCSDLCEREVEQIYSQLGLFVNKLPGLIDEFKSLWIRPLKFYHQGLDAVGLRVGKESDIKPKQTPYHPSVAEKLSTVFIEFKNALFDWTQVFNHPLEHCRFIIAWEILDFDAIKSDPIAKHVQDECGVDGTLMALPEGDLLRDVMCKIVDVKLPADAESHEQRVLDDHEIKVISLKNLIYATFKGSDKDKPYMKFVDRQETTPPPSPRPSRSSRKRKSDAGGSAAARTPQKKGVNAGQARRGASRGARQ